MKANWHVTIDSSMGTSEKNWNNADRPGGCVKTAEKKNSEKTKHSTEWQLFPFDEIEKENKKPNYR